MRYCIVTLSCLWLASAPANVPAQEKYSDYDDAMLNAARYLRKNDYPSAVAPLEAALGLAKDDAQRLKVYQALVPAYRQQPEIENMLKAQEFIIRHTDRRAGRSLPARDVVSFAFQRGKLDFIQERYDAQLKQNPKDLAALTILTMIFTQAKRGDPRGEELKKQLEELDRELGRQFAQRLEKEAENEPKTAAWQLKDAASAWLEAGDKTKALEIAKKSAASPPEQRNDQLSRMWHEGLGDVFLKVGEPQLAMTHYETALTKTEGGVLKEGLEKKLAEARGTSAGK